MWCEHGRTAATCEECAYVRALEHGRISPDTPLYPPETVDRDRAETDLDIPVGDGVTVHVRAGDLIPVELADSAKATAKKSQKARLI